MALTVSAVDLHHAYKEVLTSQAGQIVLADLIRHFGYTHRSTIGRDTHETYFNEGRRSVLLYIDRALNTDPRDHDIEEADYDGTPREPEDDFGASD